MVDRFVQSLSLLILLSVSGLNGGLSTKMSFSVAPGGAAGVAGEAVTEQGGSAWRTSYLPMMLSRPGLRCSGTCAEDSGDPIRQEGGLHHAQSRSKRARGEGGVTVGGGHSTGTLHLEGRRAFWSALRVRGGEVDRNYDVSEQLDESAKSVRAPHDTAQKAEEAISSSTSAWQHASVSKGPRSFKSYSNAEVVVTPTTDFELEGEGGEGSKLNSAASKARDTTTTQFVSECSLPTPRGRFRLRAYRHEGNGRSLEPVVMVAEGLTDLEGVPVRVHDQCLTSEVLGSLRCDCKQQLELALDYIAEHGGCVIYMQQEGRGIGLANKVAAYALQDGGLDTVDANRHLGFDDDLRSYEAVEFILNDMGIKSVKLMTNNPFKMKCLKAMGIKILSRIPMLVAPTAHSLAYLRAKAHRMSHFLHQLDDVEIMGEPPLNGAAAPVALPLDEVGAIRGGEKTAEIEAAHEEEEEGDEEEEEYAFGKESVLAAIEAVREGKCVVVTDDEGRENEGDLVFAAEKSTEDLLAFTIRHSSGVICASMEEKRLEELRLPQMVEDNEDPKMTAFTVSVDAKLGTSTGISAGDRAITLRSLADPKASPHDFNRPGHIFPLRYTAGGVLKRGGHTEAAVDLAKLAGLSPVGVLCEITTKDGKDMARVPELREFCAEHGLILTSIQDMRCLIRERQRAEKLARNGPPSCVLTR